MIVKDSKEEKIFVNNLIEAIKDIDTSVLSKVNSLENTVSLIAHAINESWEKNSKIINISKLSKSWWDINCSRDLEKYSVMERFDTNIFLSFYLFFLILYFFSFEFLFSFSEEEEACDIAVT